MARENENRSITICSKRSNPKGETVLVSPFGKEVAIVAQRLSLGKMEDDRYQKFLAGDSLELSVTIPEAEKITRVIYYRSHKDEKNEEYGEYYYAENISKETFMLAAGVDFLPGRYSEWKFLCFRSFGKLKNFLESEDDDWVEYQKALWKVWKDLYKVEGRTDETYDTLMQFHYQSLGEPVPRGEGTVKVESSSTTSATAQNPDDTVVRVDKDGNYTMGGMFLCKSVEIYKALCSIYADGGTDDAADDRIKAFFGAFKRLFKSALRAKSGGNQNASDRDFLELIFKLMKFSDDQIGKVLRVLYPPKSDEKTAAGQKAPEIEPQKPASAASDGKSDSKASAQTQPKPKSKVKGFSTPAKIDEGRKVSLATVEIVIGKIDDVIDGKLKSTFPLTDDLIGKLYRAQKALKDVIKEAETHQDADGKPQPLTRVGAKYLNEQVKFMNPKPDPDDNFAFIDDNGERYGIRFTDDDE